MHQKRGKQPLNESRLFRSNDPIYQRRKDPIPALRLVLMPPMCFFANMKRSSALILSMVIAKRKPKRRSLAAPIYVIVMLLALSPSLAVKAHTPDEDDSPAELNRRIAELCGEDKFKEAIPLAEKLVDLTRRAKGDEDPDTASGLNSLAGLYGVMGDYAKAEPLCKNATRCPRWKTTGF